MADLLPQLDLIRWIKQEKGFLHPDVEVASDPGNRGFHIRVVAGRTIRPNSRIASCPISATISILNAIDIAPFSSRGVNFPFPFLNEQSATVVQYFFLMEQYLLGRKSWWAPYISAIPPPAAIDGMMLDGSEDIRWLAGTNLKSALAKQTERWKELYMTACAQLKELRWQNIERYTWYVDLLCLRRWNLPISSRNLFLWAAVMFGSRGFTSQVLSDTLPADQARPAGHNHPRHQELSKLFSDGFAVLCPLLDILNYKPGAQVEWQPRFSYVGLQVLEQQESGQEIFNNYGPRDNENLMLGYGFAIPSNPFDHFSVGLRVPPGSPLAQARTWYPDKKKDTDFQCYIFNLNHPRAKSASCLEVSTFSFDLLDSISVLSANDRELQVMFEERKTYLSTRLASKTNGNNRNLLHVLVQLYRECQRRLSILQMSDPRLKGEVVKTTQQRYAQIYRDSQTEILATASLLCRYALLRAQKNGSTEAVLHSVDTSTQQSQLDQTVASNLQQLRHRHRPLILAPELFDLSAILQLLPPETSTPIHKILEAQSRTPETQRVQLVLLVAVLRASAPATLPARLRTWLEKLDAWYDQSWSTLIPDSDGVRALLTSVAESAETLCEKSHSATLESLIWAWNVVAEESVQIPKGLVAPHESQYDGEDAASDLLLLYIPQ
jgi:hypothetical protein